MDIRNRKGLRQEAAAALADNPGDPRKTLLVFITVTMAATLLSSLLVTVLNSRIANTGGLGGMGLRSILTTIRQVVPMAVSLALMALELGYWGTALEMSLRRSVQPRTLLMGFPRFGALIRMMFAQGLVYLLLFIAALNVGSIIFMATPLARDFYTLVVPLVQDVEALYDAMYHDPAFAGQLIRTMIPVFPIIGVLFLAAAAPVFYRYRLTRFCLLDNRYLGALAAMSQSAQMSKGHRMDLVKLDLSFWWFYLGQFLGTALAYGDVILDLCGLSLPWSATVNSYVFYGAYMIFQGLLYFLFLNRVQTTYALAYESLRPQPRPTQGGVVLGNIFDLAREYKDQ